MSVRDFDEKVAETVSTIAAIACADCKTEIGEDSWVRYFGPHRNGAMGAFEYHCGCDGSTERLFLVPRN